MDCILMTKLIGIVSSNENNDFIKIVFFLQMSFQNIMLIFALPCVGNFSALKKRNFSAVTPFVSERPTEREKKYREKCEITKDWSTCMRTFIKHCIEKMLGITFS